ncbi:MAG: hypothetical protein HPY45_03980 [Anaerolineae bacterium]|nr:hypothetical protein [Anaerolineae bacterium]
MLEKECGLSGIKLRPLPHFSWHIAEQYDVKALEGYLATFAKTQTSFWVRTAGLGIFTGLEPVLYLNLVKDTTLMERHQKIWENVSELSNRISVYYSPSYWIPHITLANLDLSDSKLECAVRQLAFRDLDFQIRASEIALLYDIEDQTGIVYKFELRNM